MMRRLLPTLLTKRLAREGAFVAGGQLVSAIAGLVSIRLFTELVPESTFGSANLLLTLLGLGTLIFVSPITQTQLRYHSFFADDKQGDFYTESILKLALTTSIAVGATLSIALILWPDARAGASVGVVWWLIPWLSAGATRGVLMNRLQAERRQMRYALWVATEAALILLFTTGLLVLSPTADSFIAGQALGTIVAIVICGLPQILEFGKAPGTGSSVGMMRRQVKSYGLPFVVFAILGWCSNLSDRYVLALYVDVAAVGQYAAAFAIASRLPALAAGIFNNLLRPVLFELETKSDNAAAERLFSSWLLGLSAVVVTLSVLLFVFGDTISLLLLAEEYRPGARVIMYWIGAGYGAVVLTQVIENRLLSFGKSHALIWTKFAGAATNILLALALIPTYGIMGAVYANAIGQGFQLIATFLSLKTIGCR